MGRRSVVALAVVALGLLGGLVPAGALWIRGYDASTGWDVVVCSDSFTLTGQSRNEGPLSIDVRTGIPLSDPVVASATVQIDQSIPETGPFAFVWGGEASVDISPALAVGTTVYIDLNGDFNRLDSDSSTVEVPGEPPRITPDGPQPYVVGVTEVQDCGPPDSDGDGIADDVDNCVDIPNTDQADNDGDGLGNACDPTPDGEPDPDCNPNYGPKPPGCP